jgi:hypothetical protein
MDLEKEVDELKSKLRLHMNELKPILFRLFELTTVRMTYEEFQIKYHNTYNQNINKKFKILFDELCVLYEDLHFMREVS